MKGLACAVCSTIRTLAPHDFDPVSCFCGNVVGWWTNGRTGEARYLAVDRSKAWGVGFNNYFLGPALSGAPRSSEAWRRLHAAQGDAPGFLFDHSDRDCWVVFFDPGAVRDVFWASEEESLVVSLPPRIREDARRRES